MGIRHASFVAVLLAVTSTPVCSFADGKGDNDPGNVRRVPRAGVEVPQERETSLRASLKILQGKIAELKSVKDAEVQALLPDVMIFERAVRVALDHDEFFSPKDVDKADQLLVEGMSRANQLLAGKAEWPNQSGLIVRGYVSRIDHTVQPYGLVVPETYAFNRSVPTRCDLWFHGRGENLSEVNFIWGRMKDAGQYTPEHTIVLHPYGRYSNAFKFAGEVDVLEALENVQERYRIDEDRISVRGFSMGGAACWQFAVHYADRWFAANPGAGFSETPEFLKFFQQETLHPTPWEESLWSMYDCDKYALNLLHCPTIAYSGENDIQKQAADVMEKQLLKHGVRLKHVIGSKMGHKIDRESKQSIERDMNELARQGRARMPKQVFLETHTLKYGHMHWLKLDRLIQHWKPTRAFAQLRESNVPGDKTVWVDIATENVSAFTLDFPAGTFNDRQRQGDTIQFQLVAHGGNLEDVDPGNSEHPRTFSFKTQGPFSDGSARITTHRTVTGKWVQGPAPDELRKRHNLQGPIDDAFMDSFVFVRPTGTAANEAVGKWAAAELERAIVHWRRHFRGDVRVVDDTDVTDDLIQSANLVLWGDPSSNQVMAKVANRLPIKWTGKHITVQEQKYDAAHHAPILIYPNPLNPDRYVVYNSSFTYRDYAYLNNARQVPMLPDWAVVDLRTPPGNVWPGKVVVANFFDEQWQLKAAK